MVEKGDGPLRAVHIKKKKKKNNNNNNNNFAFNFECVH